MKKIYVISRYRSDNPRQVDFNKRIARHFCKKIVAEGNMPVAPHLFYTQFLDDHSEFERNVGLQLGIEELQECDEFLLVVVDGVISEGMRGEMSVLSGMNGMKGRIIMTTTEEMKAALKVIL